MNIYKVSIIGAGNISSGYDRTEDDHILTHAKAILHSEHFDLVGFYDSEYIEAESAAKKWATECFKSIDIACNAADIVCICTPDKSHYQILEDVLKNQKLKAIICEKPLSCNAIQGRKLKKITESSSARVFINYSRRYQQDFAEAKQWINNIAGRLVAGTCYYGKGLLHNGSHLINLLTYFFEDLSYLYSGKAVNDYIDSDLSLEFALESNGATIFFHPISCNLVTMFGMDLIFEHGRLIYSSEEGTISYYEIEESEVYKGEENFKLFKTVYIDMNNAMVNLYKNVNNVLSGRDTVKCGVSDALVTMELCEQIASDRRL